MGGNQSVGKLFILQCCKSAVSCPHGSRKLRHKAMQGRQLGALALSKLGALVLSVDSSFKIQVMAVGGLKEG